MPMKPERIDKLIVSSEQFLISKPMQHFSVRRCRLSSKFEQFTASFWQHCSLTEAPNSASRLTQAAAASNCKLVAYGLWGRFNLVGLSN